MSHTVLNETRSPSYYFRTETGTKAIPFGHTINTFSYYGIEPHDFDPVEHDTFLDLRSDKLKVLFSGGYGPYNFFQLSIPNVIRMAEEFPDATFIFDYSHVFKEGTGKTFVPFTKKVLDLLGIENYFINNDLLPGVIVNNFIQVNTGELNVTHNNVITAARLYAEAAEVRSNVVPFRTVYLSRRNITNRNYQSLDDGLSSKEDCRIYSEPVLEKYLSGLGVQIVAPEDFETMDDQVRFFYETKTLISTTSSGLANALFMQDNTKIVEFATTMPFILSGTLGDSEGEEQLHHIYRHLAYLTNKEYISVPNYSRQAVDLIGIIEESELLQKVLRG